MKKPVALLFAFILAVSLAACGNGPSDAGLNAQTDGSAADSETTAPAAPDTTPDDGAGDSGILIAYFSWSGNTETLAGIIQTETGGDLFAIEPETPYTDDYNALLMTLTLLGLRAYFLTAQAVERRRWSSTWAAANE